MLGEGVGDARMILTSGTNVIVSTPDVPNFTTPAPPTSGPNIIVVPVPGPPGRPGAGGADDVTVADFIADPTGLSHLAVVDVIEDETEPPIDLTVLFHNAIA